MAHKWHQPASQLYVVTEKLKCLRGSELLPPATSEQALYRLLRLFLQKSERAHAAAPPFQIEPAALDYDLVS